MKKALITGIAGQDGSYLAELLLADGYSVFGLARSGANLKYVPETVKVLDCDLMDANSIVSAVRLSAPDEVYNFGGVTDLKTAYAEPEMTWKINYESVGIFLEESLKLNPSVRFLQASSSEIFLPSASLLNEESPRDWETKNPYARAKMSADRDFIVASRNEKQAFACSAFLFNHDSPRREKSAIKKITRTLAEIHLGKASSLVIGNVEQQRDWGFAGEYVRAMCDMLRAESPEDLVIASGALHTVKDVITIAAHALGMELDWQGEGMAASATDQKGKEVVTVSPEFYRPAELLPKAGDSSKAKRIIGWKSTVDFKTLVETMTASDLKDLTVL